MGVVQIIWGVGMSGMETLSGGGGGGGIIGRGGRGFGGGSVWVLKK
jgi:hypothetical protein